MTTGHLPTPPPGSGGTGAVTPRDRKEKGQVSELFEDAFRAGRGSIMGECETCGVTVFCTGSGAYGYEDKELEGLRAKAKKNPKMYREDNVYDGVSFGTVDGRDFILGCDCGGPARYERFIWQHRTQIIQYLTKRISANAQRAGEEAESLKALKGGK